MRNTLICVGLISVLQLSLPTSGARAASDLPLSASSKKNDIQGLSPGMSMADAKGLLLSQRWYCANKALRAYTLSCETRIGDLNLVFADTLSEHPLLSMRQFFRSADGPDAVTSSVTQQYGVTPQPLLDDHGNRIGSKWPLDDGSLLILAFDAGTSDYMLDLVNAPLDQKNKDAAAKAFKQANPTPRF